MSREEEEREREEGEDEGRGGEREEGGGKGRCYKGLITVRSSVLFLYLYVNRDSLTV